MGNTLRKFTGLFKNIDANVVVLGLDNAGKTAIFNRFIYNSTQPTIPTIGFNVERHKIQNVNFTMWDIGGQTVIRGLWSHYLLNIDAIVFVVDSSDKERMALVHEQLQWVMTEASGKNNKKIPLLLFANKSDVYTMNQNEMNSILGNYNNQLYKVKCVNSCALDGQGIHEGFHWLSEEIKNNQ